MEATFQLTPQDIDRSPMEILLSPSNPTPPRTLYLSNFDQLVAFPVESLFVFAAPLEEPEVTTGVARKVREAVGVLLGEYYFLAGRLRLDEGERRLELSCNNVGVPFASASCRWRLEELGDVSRPNPSFKHLIIRTEGFGGLFNTPVFTIQVTRFACGGFSLGFVINHSVLDGRSVANMYVTLAAICRGQDTSKFQHIHIDRTCLKPRNPPQIKYPHEEFTKLTDAISSFTSTSTSRAMTPSSRLEFSSNHSSKVFPFTGAMIATLKDRCDLPKCTTFEVLVAHIWRCRTRVVFGDDLDSISSVLYAVDVRSRLSPPLPDAFVGNAVVSSCASARASNVASGPLGFCALKIREAMERITDEYVRSALDWVEVHQGVPSTAGQGGRAFYVSAWWKLPFHEIDFGHGTAVFGGPVASGMDEFVLLLADAVGGGGEGGGGVRVWIVLEKEQMERFENVVYQI